MKKAARGGVRDRRDSGREPREPGQQQISQKKKRRTAGSSRPCTHLIRQIKERQTMRNAIPFPLPSPGVGGGPRNAHEPKIVHFAGEFRRGTRPSINSLLPPASKNHPRISSPYSNHCMRCTFPYVECAEFFLSFFFLMTARNASVQHGAVPRLAGPLRSSD